MSWKVNRTSSLSTQLANLLDGLGRAVGVVILNEVDLAAVYAALVVDHLDIGGLGLADDRIG